MVFGVGVPLIFVSVTTASYHGIPRDKTDQASALINAARNTGGSIGISIASNVLAHREQFHQSRLVESIIPSSSQYQDTVRQVTNYFVAQVARFFGRRHGQSNGSDGRCRLKRHFWPTWTPSGSWR